MSTVAAQPPELHLSVERGVINAPAAVLLDGATWHLFHQYRPTGDRAPRWGHQVSSDSPFEWEECDDALAPQGEETQVRAGSLAVIDDTVHLYFTSVSKGHTAIELAVITDLEATTASISEERLTVNPYVRREAVILSDNDGAPFELFNFRSPCVVPAWKLDDDRSEGHSGWLMLSVAGTSDHPVLAMASSNDGRNWSVDGSIDFSGPTDLEDVARVVSPRVVRLRDELDGIIRDVLILTCENDDGPDVSGYLIGQFKGTTFTVERPFHRLDFGHDFCRPRNTHFTTGTVPEEERWDRAVLVGLLGDLERYDDPATHLDVDGGESLNTISLPRVSTLQGGTLFQTPTAGIIEQVNAAERAWSWSGLCEIPNDDTSAAVIVDLIAGSGEHEAVAARITHRGSTLELDRSMNRHHRGDAPALAELGEADSDTLTIIVDGSTVEVFADGGAVAMASLVRFDGGCTDIRFSTTGPARVDNHLLRSPTRADNVLPDWIFDELDAEDSDGDGTVTL